MTREFNSNFGRDNLLAEIQNGVMQYTFKGRRCLKSPFDLAIYMKLFYDLNPKTIIEIGSKDGGSAIFFKNLISIFGLYTKIYSVDIEPVRDLQIEGIEFMEGDVKKLEKVFDSHFFETIQRPLLVIEDSSHVYQDVMDCMHFFAQKLHKGDMLVIEDGILEDLGLSEKYNGGPNRALHDFFAQYPNEFKVATEYCDLFGHNVTYNPNGYLWKL